MEFRTRFSLNQSRPKVLCTSEEGKTMQEFVKDCDINLIIAKYRKTGVLPESARKVAAQYGDFSQVPTFQEMQEKINLGMELFAALPAKVRKQFSNDPAEFLSAAETDEGRKLMVTLGLGKESPLGESPSSPVQGESAGTEPAPSLKAKPPTPSVDSKKTEGSAEDSQSK